MITDLPLMTTLRMHRPVYPINAFMAQCLEQGQMYFCISTDQSQTKRSILTSRLFQRQMHNTISANSSETKITVVIKLKHQVNSGIQSRPSPSPLPPKTFTVLNYTRFYLWVTLMTILRKTQYASPLCPNFLRTVKLLTVKLSPFPLLNIS